MKAEPYATPTALRIIDRTQAGLYDALRLLDMIDAISRLCEDPESDASKQDLQAIYRGLTIVIEHLHRDIATANQGVDELWRMMKGDAAAGDAQ